MSKSMWCIMLAGLLGAAAAASSAEPRKVTGVLAAVGKDSITLQCRSNQTETVALNPATAIKINGEATTPADLKAGMRITALVQDTQPATEIRAFVAPPISNFSVKGKIIGLNPGSFTVLAGDGTTNTVAYNDRTIVWLKERMGKTSDLRVGLAIVALAPNSQPAVEIRVLQPQPKQQPLP